MKKIFYLFFCFLYFGMFGVVNAAHSVGNLLIGETYIAEAATCSYTGEIAKVFMYDGKCYITGIAEGNVEMELYPEDTEKNLPATTVSLNFSKGTISEENKLTLKELAHTINTGNVSEKIKLEKLSLETKPEGAALYEIVAAFDETNSKFLIYFGYDVSDKEIISMAYDANANKINGMMRYASSTADSSIPAMGAVKSATFDSFVDFGANMFDYVMEASPNYQSGIDIYEDSSKYSLISSETSEALKNKYVKYEVNKSETSGNASLEVLLSNQYNNELVTEYKTALALKEEEERKKAEAEKEAQTEKNPPTGDYFGIAVICIVLFVSIALIHKNKLKMLEM